MTDKRPLTLSLFMARLASGFVGGITGTLALFIVFFLLNSVLPPTDGQTSLSIFAIIVMTFFGTLTANLATSLMVTVVDGGKYNRRKTTLVHVFLFNLVFFFLTIPFYIVGSGLDMVNAVAVLHLLLSAFVSALILEVIAGAEYSLMGLYSTALGILVSVGFALLALRFDTTPTTLMFLAMPMVWIILQISGAFTEVLYDNFVRFYGIEAFSTKTDLGGDTEIESKDEDEMEEGVDKEDGR